MQSTLFHQFLKTLKDHNISHKKILVAVSGGLDSVALLSLFKEVSNIQNLDLLVSCVHHGASLDPKLNTFRNQSEQLVIDVCESISIPFIKSEKPSKELKSEEDFRNFRYEQFEKMKQKNQFDLLSLAHNSDDILETRLLFMIRGCGLEALKSMQILKGELLRPFLQVSRQSILEYSKSKKLTWLEDPSNQDNKFLRNWLRNDWLTELEKKKSGAKKRLAESLNNFVSEKFLESSFPEDSITEQGLCRNSLRQMPLAEQQRMLALYMKQKNIKDYGQSHIKELLKHLDRSQKNITLKLLKKNWKITERFIICD